MTKQVLSSYTQGTGTANRESSTRKKLSDPSYKAHEDSYRSAVENDKHWEKAAEGLNFRSQKTGLDG